MNNEQIKFWNKAGIAYLKLLSTNSYVETKENHESDNTVGIQVKM